MPIEFTEGDVMTNTEGAQAIAQEVNAVGIMNTQLNVKLRNRYPMMYQEYQALCQSEPPQFRLGDVFLWQAMDGLWVFNVAIFENEFCSLAAPRVIEAAFRQMRIKADEAQITSIAMPPIAGGVGLLWWASARNSLERAFRNWGGTIYVYVKRPKEERPKPKLD